MRKFVLIVMALLLTVVAFAQPRPFEIDQSFIPSLEYMQKSWTGEYDGLDPNSRMILSIKRKLILNADFTYFNEVRGQIKNESEEILLKSEIGTYQYDSGTQFVTYIIEMDSTLDINFFLQGKEVDYVVNHYKQNGEEKTSIEKTQFTRGVNDDTRQWVLFDQQLMSPIDPRQKAVYVMNGSAIEPSGLFAPSFNTNNNSGDIYNLFGNRIKKPCKGIFIINKKKVFINK